MKMKSKVKKEVHWRCKKCGDEIYWNTHKKMIICKCGALGVDGCEFYVRLIGNEADREQIKKVREKPVVSKIEP
mgnify:FL=1